MLEKLREIETSAIKELVKINEEQDQLQDYLSKAEEKKGKVTEAVYQRVLQDYQNRCATLNDKSLPLKEEARKAYRKLRSLHEQFNAAFEEARLAKEELEFRHEVGELADEKMTELLREAEEVLEKRRNDLEEAEKLKQEFIEAFRSEEELEVAPKPEVRPAPPPPEREKTAEPEPAGAPADSGSSDKTILLPTDSLPSSETAGEGESSQSSPPSGDRTVIVPQATLVYEEKGRPPVEYNLGLITSIGRTPDNQIRIPETKVSRKHAVVTASAAGFTIKDLESQNGTFVNDEQVTECRLNNGDRIRIGEKQFVFRSS